MSIFPLSASVGQVFNSYIFDGTSWNIDNSIFENYLEESTASATYLDKISASTIYATKDYADNSSSVAAAAVVDAAPEALNTLNELAAALNDDANFASTITTALGNKLDISSASSTYLTQVNASNTYLSQSSASTTYSPIVPVVQTGFRNAIINGDMRIDQRRGGSSFNTPGGGGVYTYGTDRWFSYSSGSQAATQRLYDSGYYYTRIANNSIAEFTLGQRIESINSYHLAGKTVTLSFRMSSTASSVTWAASYANTTDAFGTQTSPTVTSITSGTVTPTSSFANYSVTFSIPSNATTGLQITFTTELGLDINMQLTNVQLELGSIATPFEQRPIATELALCQRYYYKSPYVVSPYILFNSGNVMSGTYQFPVTMRVAPASITYYDGANTVNRISIANAGGTAQNNITPPNSLNILNSGWNFGAGGMGGTTGNNGNIMLGSYEASAEL